MVAMYLIMYKRYEVVKSHMHTPHRVISRTFHSGCLQHTSKLCTNFEGWKTHKDTTLKALKYCIQLGGYRIYLTHVCKISKPKYQRIGQSTDYPNIFYNTFLILSQYVPCQCDYFYPKMRNKGSTNINEHNHTPRCSYKVSTAGCWMVHYFTISVFNGGVRQELTTWSSMFRLLQGNISSIIWAQGWWWNCRFLNDCNFGKKFTTAAQCFRKVPKSPVFVFKHSTHMACLSVLFWKACNNLKSIQDTFAVMSKWYGTSSFATLIGRLGHMYTLTCLSYLLEQNT